MYLVVKCTELADPYECDADRKPMFITEDKNEAFKTKNRKYPFEVWQTTGINGKNLVKIKDYDS